MKDEILKHSSELFLTQGFKSVTMDDIATHMGISKKTIYTSFTNKTELVREVGLKILTDLKQTIECLVGEHMNPIEELYEIKKYVMHYLKGERSYPIQQMQKYYPRIYDELKNDQYEFMQRCVLRNLNNGLEKGLYRRNLEPEFVARIYFLGITGIKDQSLFPLEQFAPASLHESYLEYHLRGIVTPEGRKILNNLIHSNED
ncbi:MAG: TetR family transcriptional regulator [Leeuwenhoekiella sp.]|uniref:TetR family transcriptional regulator n=1 Tax=Leeuwenhoekiella nanhaiensis TaxID=1655491 RepID=A0A2G1VWE3_9FLAO|nr:TetR/AcrR family transcriptional regulator [Leeuwenhoekiella nanhaiensis]PHQ31084.1 TetR family transcriptional regulator [Leeuwenhoekiella nanhaiensis]PHR98565.1 MAG: TetR family transcriptional regulator [Leeuwenhoekiella sp.]